MSCGVTSVDRASWEDLIGGVGRCREGRVLYQGEQEREETAAGDRSDVK